jgi:hypothetical protein
LLVREERTEIQGCYKLMDDLEGLQFSNEKTY